MEEIGLVYTGVIRLFVAVFIAFIYSRAGRGWKLPLLGKVRRRVYCPLVMCLALLGFSLWEKTFTWWLLGVLVATWGIAFGFLSIGYGAGSVIRKYLGKQAQQIIVGLLQGGSCGLIPLVSGRWGVYILCCVSPVLCLGLLGGVFDSDETGGVTAAWKELLTAMSIFTFPLFLI